MKYLHLSAAIYAFESGQNVAELLRSLKGEEYNTEEIIEIAYDLQTGSYIKERNASTENWRDHVAEVASILGPHIEAGDTVLDAGTGEMTTFVGIANHCYDVASDIYAMDISWSRVATGRALAEKELRPNLFPKLKAFVGELRSLPLLDKSIDVIWTTHAIEPNGGQETRIVRELMRVARKKIVLFEPSYEHNSPEGQDRMRRLGYVRDLPGAIEAAGGRLLTVQKIETAKNPLNPTYAFIVDNADTKAVAPTSPWACPTTGSKLEVQTDCLWSLESKLAYPILKGIPVLRRDAAILASALDNLDSRCF